MSCLILDDLGMSKDRISEKPSLVRVNWRQSDMKEELIDYEQIRRLVSGSSISGTTDDVSQQW